LDQSQMLFRAHPNHNSRLAHLPCSSQLLAVSVSLGSLARNLTPSVLRRLLRLLLVNHSKRKHHSANLQVEALDSREVQHSDSLLLWEVAQGLANLHRRARLANPAFSAQSQTHSERLSSLLLGSQVSGNRQRSGPNPIRLGHRPHLAHSHSNKLLQAIRLEPLPSKRLHLLLPKHKPLRRPVRLARSQQRLRSAGHQQLNRIRLASHNHLSSNSSRHRAPSEEDSPRPLPPQRTPSGSHPPAHHSHSHLRVPRSLNHPQPQLSASQAAPPQHLQRVNPAAAPAHTDLAPPASIQTYHLTPPSTPIRRCACSRASQSRTKSRGMVSASRYLSSKTLMAASRGCGCRMAHPRTRPKPRPSRRSIRTRLSWSSGKCLLKRASLRAGSCLRCRPRGSSACGIFEIGKREMGMQWKPLGFMAWSGNLVIQCWTGHSGWDITAS
jgi:hypothetical protein